MNSRRPTIDCIREALSLIGRDELRRRAQVIRSQQMDLGWGGEFLTVISLELAARETCDQHRHEAQSREQRSTFQPSSLPMGDTQLRILWQERRPIPPALRHSPLHLRQVPLGPAAQTRRSSSPLPSSVPEPDAIRTPAAL